MQNAPPGSWHRRGVTSRSFRTAASCLRSAPTCVVVCNIEILRTVRRRDVPARSRAGTRRRAQRARVGRAHPRNRVSVERNHRDDPCEEVQSIVVKAESRVPDDTRCAMHIECCRLLSAFRREQRLVHRDATPRAAEFILKAFRCQEPTSRRRDPPMHVRSPTRLVPRARITLGMFIAATLCALLAPRTSAAQDTRARARALGVAPGIFRTGPLDGITDVHGVLVGQVTVTAGDSVHTGITAILPHAGNMFTDRVPAAVYVGNAFGKLVGATQVNELGELETPILLTCTLCVWRAADALVAEMLAQPGMQNVVSINPVVGETNDGWLNAIRSRPVTADDVHRALTAA